MHLIGIDCATQPNKTGLALGALESGRVRIERCQTGSAKHPPVSIVRDWIGQGDSVLLALDAPLGWAAPLGQALQRHAAGGALEYSADALFQRATDRSIWGRFGKKPLEIGADRISRTTVAALQLLKTVVDDPRCPIPLAWHPEALPAVSAIEVYPAVTRLARGAPDHGGSLDGLSGWIEFGSGIDTAQLTVDAVDAAVCVLAAADFIEGRAFGPPDLTVAQREGWIWAPPAVACLVE
jgi:hypothetical protein